MWKNAQNILFRLLMDMIFLRIFGGNQVPFFKQYNVLCDIFKWVVKEWKFASWILRIGKYFLLDFLMFLNSLTIILIYMSISKIFFWGSTLLVSEHPCLMIIKYFQAISFCSIALVVTENRVSSKRWAGSWWHP